jgi:hypothetical protein
MNLIINRVVQSAKTAGATAGNIDKVLLFPYRPGTIEQVAMGKDTAGMTHMTRYCPFENWPLSHLSFC